MWCSGIQPIMSTPKYVTALTDKQVATLSLLKMKEEKTIKDFQTIIHLTEKAAKWDDPPLNKTAMMYLTKRYGWEKYAKKAASIGAQMAFYEKGTLLEGEAIELLSTLDKTGYTKNNEALTNDYLLGKCDIVTPGKSKIIDIKVAWNISTFLGVFNSPLKPLYWYQMQGYLDLYQLDHGEVCFCLLNTPEGLVEREKIKLLNKYVFGEINREDYDKNMESLDLSLSYNNIPMKRRVVRFRVDRRPELMPKVYKKVEKCREWLTAFEKSHVFNKEIITLAEHYAYAKENNIESDPDEPREIDQG